MAYFGTSQGLRPFSAAGNGSHETPRLASPFVRDSLRFQARDEKSDELQCRNNSGEESRIRGIGVEGPEQQKQWGGGGVDDLARELPHISESSDGDRQP